MTLPLSENIPLGRLVEYYAQAEANPDVIWAPSLFGVPWSTVNNTKARADLAGYAAALPGGHLTSLVRVWADDDGVEHRTVLI